MTNTIDSYLSELIRMANALPREDINTVADILYEAYVHHRQIFILGNGGSAANASHLACDLSKGTLQRVYDHEEKRFRVVSLTDNVPILTAFANDLTYDDVFSQQLHNLLNADDVVIAISGSGNSKNAVKAIELARARGAITVGFLGFKGGKLAELVDHAIVVPSSNYGVIEDLHSVTGHILTTCLAQRKKNGNESSDANR